jgi:calreticulin
MQSKVVIAVLLGLVAHAAATTYFKETFDAGWESRWVKSSFKESEGTQGKWGWSAGKHHSASNEEEEKGLQTTEDARFYQISAKFPEFSNKGKDLVLQYSIKHEQNIDCGGGYIKLMPAGFEQQKFNGDTPYLVMFGPDICGSSTRRVHMIFNYKGQNHLIKKTVACESDELTHLYTMIVKPDNTYKIEIDGVEKASGSLKEDWDMLQPKQIKDPKASKPADWVDERQIADPNDKKPENWDSIPAEIPDPNAKKPEDWDDELDGAWEAPMIPNPDYKGEWKPKMIDNPAYKGEWVHPLIDNPDFVDDDTLYSYKDIAGVGIEIWQVKSGTIFDNIIVTDSVEEAKALAAKTTAAQKAEKAAKDKADEEARKKAEEEEKKRQEEEAKKGAEGKKDEEEEAGKDEL